MNLSTCLTIGALLLNIVSFLLGRKSSARDDGERDGNVLSKLDSIGDSIHKIDGRLSNLECQLGEQRDRLTRLETKMEMYHPGGGHGA